MMDGEWHWKENKKPNGGRKDEEEEEYKMMTLGR